MISAQQPLYHYSLAQTHDNLIVAYPCNPFSTKYGIWTLAIFVLSTLVNDLGQWSFLFPLSTTISLRAINLHVGFAILIFCWTVAPGLARNCGQFFCSMKFGLMFQLDIVFLYHAAWTWVGLVDEKFWGQRNWTSFSLLLFFFFFDAWADYRKLLVLRVGYFLSLFISFSGGR